MTSEEYTPVSRGALKFKGGAPSSGIKKKKKKAPKPASTTDSPKNMALESALAVGDDSAIVKGKGKAKEGEEKEGEEMDEKDLRELDPRGGDGKTASERAYEEMRRKRLQERLQKEGTKTHKQRVEGLNQYLAKLSEHHDMPRIGPG